MNTDTGELKRLVQAGVIPDGFTPVPEKLEKEADQFLGGSDSIMVDMEKDTPLVKWARQHNHTKKNNRKAMQKASKKQNRK